MNILLTSGSSKLARIVAKGLESGHEVRLTDRLTESDSANYAHCALGHDLATDLLVSNLDAVVHVGEPLEGEGEQSYIDYMTRGTYNLCTAMSNQGVSRLVLLNTLEVMNGYDDRFRISELYRPVPTDGAYMLGKHLAEYVSKEFAREKRLTVVVLRIAKNITTNDEGSDSGTSNLSEAALVNAVAAALTCELSPWTVLHVISSHSHKKFNTRLAQQTLGLNFKPAASMDQPTPGGSE